MTRVLVIAGTASGVGKTSITLGLARALRNRGLRVLAAKVGPDYLDPKQLACATGRPCLNLDAFMMGKPYILDLLARATAGIDLLLVEGVMGLFDGVSPEHNDGSTAAMAEWLSSNVLLVAEAGAVARSFAATVQGFVGFPMGNRIAGVVANRVGSDAHAVLLTRALQSVGLPPLLAHVPVGGLPTLPSRHLGLIAPEGDGAFETLAAAVEHHLPLDRVLALATPLPPSPRTSAPTRPSALRLAVAEDAAFSFIYADLRQSLETRGVSWLTCSPLRDTTIPEDAEALYLPGGYPEEHAVELALNRPFLDSLRRFASERPVYAECGGLMLLCQTLVDRDGKTHKLAGIVPGCARMGRKLTRLGYAEVTLVEDSLWGKVGEKCRGHEFRYSDLDLDESVGNAWRRAYQIQYQDGLCATEGFQRGRVLASYVHLHLASRPWLLDGFLERLSQP